MVFYRGRGVHGRIVETLGRLVVSGEAGEESTLDPRALAEEFGVSLTVIRESLKVLAGKGLVAARQKHGTFVRPRSEWNVLDADVIRWRMAGGEADELLRDLAELRLIVEPATVRRAAGRRTDADLSALDRALEDMGAAGEDPVAAAAADTAFHRALLTASGNELLARLHEVIEPALHARDSIVHARHHTAGDPVPSHRAVVDGIRARDPDRAADAMADLLAKASADHDLAVRGSGALDGAPGATPT
ncbi:FadR/GntR family transcriptional regulator [Streptomyces sp. 8L]|uniref:FadR/GntR family transcriptional regulator n=1 Tax=Streptomyces sp. 8L TaxID=2877242 RepID=UPI001CD40E44|nr:FadR/GntR family transcriptional regulator [Streptomyces sp. 8L]MCA1223945.1 FadR family transcriptional regulator [Streptomyces sp. 8L]